MLNRLPVKPFVLLALGLTAFCCSAFAGLDGYRIYLNNQLLIKQYVNQPVSLNGLQLNKAGDKDMLVVYYDHCGGVPGKERRLSVRDEQGHVLKEWQFADANGSNAAMPVPAKEIIALQAKAGHLALYYSSQFEPGGRILAHVGSAEKTTAKAKTR